MSKRKISDTGGATSKRVHRTRSITADAGKACFLTAELLENIIVRLPQQAIVASQRVSRQFRDIVRTSVMIQEKLFIRCTGDSNLVWELVYDENPRIQVAKRGAQVDLGISRVKGINRLARYRSHRLAPVRLNPSLTLSRLISPGTAALQRVKYSAGEFLQIASKAIYESLASPVGIQSWESQFLTDPPCKFAHVTVYWKTHCGLRKEATGRLERDFEDVDGLTLGHMWRAIWRQKSDVTCWTGSRYHTMQQGTLRRIWTKLNSEGYKSAENFRIEELFLNIKGIVVPTDEECLAAEKGDKPVVMATVEDGEA